MKEDTMTFPRTRQGVRDLDAVSGDVLPVSGGPAPGGVNVGQAERYLSAAGGAALAVYGVGRGSLAGLGLALVGGSLLYRAFTGHCQLYDALGLNTAHNQGSESHVERVYRTS